MGNIVRRILRLIREEWAAPTNKHADGDGAEEESTVDEESSTSGAYSGFDSTARGVEPNSALLSAKATSADSQYSLSNFVLHGRPYRETSGLSLFSSSTFLGNTPAKRSKNAQSIRPALISAIEEVVDDLETVFDSVSSTAKDHIHSEYVSLWTLGGSQ